MRMRITVRKRDDDLEVANSLRRDLWAHSPVEIDLDDPTTGVQRTAPDRLAFFEFDTRYPDEAKRVVREYNYESLVIIDEQPSGQPVAGA